MRLTTKQFPISRLAATLLALAALLALPWGTAAAQGRVSGSAFGTYVSGVGQSGSAVLPDTGGFNGADVNALSLPGTLSADALTSMTTGAVDQKRSTAQSSSHLENVSLLNGLLTAETVIAVASSTLGNGSTGTNALGSGFSNLVINGAAVGGGDYSPAPNTQLALPGVGYVVLNEQVTTGDGVSSAGITVNMIHVVLQNTLTGLQTGEIIVGSASSGTTN